MAGGLASWKGDPERTARSPPAQDELRAAYEAGGPRALLERFRRFEQERTGAE
jgi:hypothetical protein